MSETEESIIKIEKVKEEPDVTLDDSLWNSTIWEASAFREVEKEEGEGDDEELVRPAAVFVKEEVVEEEKDPTFGAEFSVGLLKENGSFISGRAMAAGPSGVVRSLKGGTSCGGGKPFSAQGGAQVHGCNETSGSGDLISHMRGLVHNMLGGTLHPCSVCKKTFRERHNLVTHMRTHTGEKPFACDICEMSFIEKGDLIGHKRVHTEGTQAGEKRFTCSICTKGFTQRTSLNIHKRKHTGERPYACTLCGNSFRRKHHLDYHMNKSSRHSH